LRLANNKDKQLVADILVSAFAKIDEDNSINFIVKQDSKRLERMHVLMGYLFDRALLFGEVYLSDNEQACVLLKFPHREKTNLKTISLDINLALKCIGITRVYKVLKRQKIAKRNYPKEKHIRPVILGVKNANQGKGSAARLMLQVLNKYKGNTLPVIIDTASVENVELYKKLGFKVFKTEDNLGFPMYFLRMN
jgi:ribosomal protein S18 acetylase RimI-like enzyme